MAPGPHETAIQDIEADEKARPRRSKGTDHRKGESRLRSGTGNVPCQIVADFIMNEPIDRLRCHFGLTPAEARLAFHLARGETLRSAAVKLGISYETTRSSLKKIFRKTATCRQAELVIVILTALPENCRPTSSSVWSLFMPIPKRMRSTRLCL
jgi:DNA-binding CsgD family transcriptional regulator